MEKMKRRPRESTLERPTVTIKGRPLSETLIEDRR